MGTKKKPAIAGAVLAALGSGLGSVMAVPPPVREDVKYDHHSVLQACYRARPEEQCRDGIHIHPSPLLSPKNRSV